MAKVRRFSVGCLEGTGVGAEFALPSEEGRHLHVLRLKPGHEIELRDPQGRSVRAEIVEDSPSGVRVRVLSVELTLEKTVAVKLILGVAWPKGKRAAMLVEKCAELGVNEIVPIQFERGVVSKDDESEGLVRLRRIAAEASKQSRRDDVMSIGAEMTLRDFLTQFSDAKTLVLDPYADSNLVVEVQNMSETSQTLALLIGPEGGLTEGEIAQATQSGVSKVRMAAHVLRIETAAIAAAAICGAVLKR